MVGELDGRGWLLGSCCWWHHPGQHLNEPDSVVERTRCVSRLGTELVDHITFLQIPDVLALDGGGFKGNRASVFIVWPVLGKVFSLPRRERREGTVSMQDRESEPRLIRSKGLESKHQTYRGKRTYRLT